MDKIYIVIEEWQKYLGLRLDNVRYPTWLAVPYRNFRYGNAQNVCLYSDAMEQFLIQQQIRHCVVGEG